MTPDFAGFAAEQWQGLTFADRFTVWTMRLWLAGETGDRTAVERADAAFAKLGIASPFAHLDALMRTVSEGARRPIRLAPVHVPWLCEDEARLLDALALAQVGGTVDTLMLLRPMLTAEACRDVRCRCRDYAMALNAAGLTLNGPAGAPRPHGHDHGAATQRVSERAMP